MYKPLFLSFILFAMLTACSKQESKFNSYDEARDALYALNSSFVKSPSQSKQVDESQPIVFSDDYLKVRHLILQSLMDMDLVQRKREQLNYLVIAERFPERFFMWPPQVNVLANMLANSNLSHNSTQIITWLKLTQEQLDLAKQSNLKLNKLERTLLLEYISDSLAQISSKPALKEQVSIFKNYLGSYKPRSSFGLRGLPNGSQWYQSKLNYFSGIVHSPLEWVAVLNKKNKNLNPYSFNQNLAIHHQRSFLVQFVSKEPAVLGLDWQTHYLDLPAMASSMKLSESDKTLMLAMMETDIGIHYHAWTLQQAKVNLLQKLVITTSQAQYLVNDIILYPGQSFSFFSQL